MTKTFTIFFIFLTWAYSSSIYAPSQQIKVDGTAKDMVHRGNTLIIGTDSGKLQRYDYTTKVLT